MPARGQYSETANSDRKGPHDQHARDHSPLLGRGKGARRLTKFGAALTGRALPPKMLASADQDFRLCILMTARNRPIMSSP